MNSLQLPIRTLRHTRRAAAANRLGFVSIRFHTDHFARSFLLAITKLWNLLPSEVVESSDLQKFKRSANLLPTEKNFSIGFGFAFEAMFFVF